MAKSIFDVLATGTTETSVPSQGKDDKGNALTFEHSLPQGLFPTDAQYESAADLLSWAEGNGFTHAVLQRGIQKFLIEVRATYKGCKKEDTWDAAYGQANVDEMEWSIVKRPNQGGSNQAIAKAVLQETVNNMQLMIDVAGLTEKKIMAVLNDKFDNQEDIVGTILAALNFSK
jgi:hypothetical protein